MQTFSYMRRDSINYTTINSAYILFGFAILYAIISPIFYFLTPLLGFCFYYLAINFEDEDKKLENILIIIYVTFVELNYGLFVFSFLLFFALVYNLILKPLKESIIDRWILKVVFVLIAYLGYFLFNHFIGYIFNFQTQDIGWGYLVFIVSDIFLVFLLL